MTKDKIVSLDLMRKERRTYEAIYLQFINNRKYHKTYAFCFYEGEDGKYYNSRIREKFRNSFITFSVGNKKEVLKLLSKIKGSGLYEDVCTMFFVDRDYDVSMATYDEDLFETPCYSIENLYVQPECLIKILQSEFSLNRIDEDCKKCFQDFELREHEFNAHMLEFNSLAYLRRKKSDSNSNYSFGSVKTTHLVKVEVSKVSIATKYNETIAEIKSTLQFDESEIEEAKRELIEKGNYSLNFRGKNQLDFFVEFINGLKLLNDKGGYFSTKHNSIHINITANRLSELSQYAITPPELKKFLKKQKNKFIALSAG